MNILQRSLIEKAGHENGFENILPSSGDSILLGSAKHRARASITLFNKDQWLLEVHSAASKHLLFELIRSFPDVPQQNERFILASINQLAIMLRRAAKLAQALPNQVAFEFEAMVENELIKLSVDDKNGTEIERMVRQRIGQNAFRTAMLDYWGGACAVTGITVSEALRASHAKPWADCLNDVERLDVFNGFLLCANLDALFDRFLISFDDEGVMLVSVAINPEQRFTLGLDQPLALRWLAFEHMAYLDYHRNMFMKIQKNQNI